MMVKKITNGVTAVVLVIALLTGSASAANYYVDIVVCEQPPAAIEWSVLYMDVAVWEVGNGTNMDINDINPTLGSSLIYSDHQLQGSPSLWNASIIGDEQRVYGYDGKYYLIRWYSVSSYNNSNVSNIVTLHVDFTWQVDPNQN